LNLLTTVSAVIFLHHANQHDRQSQTSTTVFAGLIQLPEFIKNMRQVTLRDADSSIITAIAIRSAVNSTHLQYAARVGKLNALRSG